MNKWTIFLNLGIPILIESVILFVYVFEGGYGGSTLTVILMWTYWVILPVTLVVVNLALFFSGVGASFLKCTFLMLSGLLLGLAIGYIRWGMTTKNLFHPDAETVALNQALAIFYISLAGGYFLIVKVVYFMFQSLAKR